MTERERLEELILSALRENVGKSVNLAGNIADHLLQNGVIVPPCKVGDTVWVIWQGFNDEPKIRKDSVWYFTVNSDEIGYETDHLSGGVYGVDLFLTREEAEKALKESEKNG